MNNNSLIIMKQVALKGAVEIVKSDFNCKENVTEQLEVTKQIANNLFEWLQDGVQTDPTVEIIQSAGMDATVKSVKPKVSCPNCGSMVWDNRETAKDKQPLWKCSNKDTCDNGKGFPWASWDEDEFDNALKKAEAQEPVDNGAPF